MKKIVSFALAFALLCTCLLAFASCGGVSGTYENELGSYKFTAFGKVTESSELLGFDTVYSYSIEEDDDGEKTLVLVAEKCVYEGDDEDIKELVADMNEELKEESEEDRTLKYYFAEGEEEGKAYVAIGANKLLSVKYWKK